MMLQDDRWYDPIFRATIQLVVAYASRVGALPGLWQFCQGMEAAAASGAGWHPHSLWMANLGFLSSHC
eukprot:1231086-Lingulodinium_polyedra.AAC.1